MLGWTIPNLGTSLPTLLQRIKDLRHRSRSRGEVPTLEPFVELMIQCGTLLLYHALARHKFNPFCMPDTKPAQKEVVPIPTFRTFCWLPVLLLCNWKQVSHDTEQESTLPFAKAVSWSISEYPSKLLHNFYVQTSIHTSLLC